MADPKPAITPAAFYRDPMAALRWLISFAVLPHSDAETSKSAKRADSGEPIPSTEGAS